MIERALNAELGHHLCYPAGTQHLEDGPSQRNGKSGKTVLAGYGPLRLDIPRDRDGSFSPILIPKHERFYTRFDDKIIAMYVRGMIVRKIRAFISGSTVLTFLPTSSALSPTRSSPKSVHGNSGL